MIGKPILIGGLPWTTAGDATLKEDHDCYGMCLSHLEHLVLYTKAAHWLQRRTMWEEVLHAIDYLEGLNLGEKRTGTLANYLAGLPPNNPGWMKWFALQSSGTSPSEIGQTIIIEGAQGENDEPGA